jgi:hypothetical protein
MAWSSCSVARISDIGKRVTGLHVVATVKLGETTKMSIVVPRATGT